MLSRRRSRGSGTRSPRTRRFSTGNQNFELPRPTAGWARPAARNGAGGGVLGHAPPAATRTNPRPLHENGTSRSWPHCVVKPGQPYRKTPTGEELTKLPLHELRQALALTQRRRLREPSRSDRKRPDEARAPVRSRTGSCNGQWHRPSSAARSAAAAGRFQTRRCPAPCR